METQSSVFDQINVNVLTKQIPKNSTFHLITDNELCVYGAYDYAQVSPLFTDAHHRGLA